jgi:hypothetical protein
MPVLGTAFLGMGRGILEEASTVWDGMGGGPRSAAGTPTGDTTDKEEKSLHNDSRMGGWISAMANPK